MPPDAPPRLLTTNQELRLAVAAAQRERKTLGVVPTMGALHAGHLSLVEAARSECDLVVATLFVNPTQFAPGEDYERYPRDREKDRTLLAGAGCDLLFAPPVEEIFPPDCKTTVDVGPAGQTLEGEIRPTHFRGVATVVLKLLNLTGADRAYFGRKDYQQTVVVRRLVRDLNTPTEIRVCPIVREPDGVAMSSRNAYLSPDERRQATCLSRALREVKSRFEAGETRVKTLRRLAEEIVSQAGAELQYAAFLEDGTLDPVGEIRGPTTVAIAALVGKTRLIDNLLIG